MPTERDWVNGLVDRFQSALHSEPGGDANIEVLTQFRLAYTNEIEQYTKDEPSEYRRAGYATDILVRDVNGDSWVPRLVIETKLESLTTHDALTYSSKASTHKHVHPYLRYGILIGGWGDYALPARLFRHGVHFDYMMTWRDYEPTHQEWNRWIQVVISEIHTSRKIQELLTTSRQAKKKSYFLAHRPLNLE
jgi:hypothetical protein